MKKTLEDELMSLAHRILHLRGREDLEQMKELTGELYEKLSVLSFAEKHFSGMQPTIGLRDVEEALSETKEESAEPKEEKIVAETTTSKTSTAPKAAEISEEETKSEQEPETSVEIEEQEDIPTSPEEEVYASKPDLEKPSSEAIDEPTETEQEEDTFVSTEEDNSLSHLELEETEEESPEDTDDSEIDLREISVHFDDLPQFEPISLDKTEPQPQDEEEIFPEFPDPKPKQENQPEEKLSTQAPSLEDLFPTAPKAKNRNESTGHKRSLNERLKVGLSFGLNDRLAFINNLFDGSSADFNRVVSQLNSFENYSEAQNFIEDQIKPDYNWEDKADYEERFLEALEQRMEE